MRNMPSILSAKAIGPAAWTSLAERLSGATATLPAMEATTPVTVRSQGYQVLIPTRSDATTPRLPVKTIPSMTMGRSHAISDGRPDWIARVCKPEKESIAAATARRNTASVLSLRKAFSARELNPVAASEVDMLEPSADGSFHPTFDG